jgi:hypothetical protein
MPSLDRIKWLIVAGGAGLLAAKLTQTALGAGWRSVQHTEPPTSADSVETPTGEAVLWAVFLGAGVALAKLAAVRGAASLWRRSTGHEPPAND